MEQHVRHPISVEIASEDMVPTSIVMVDPVFVEAFGVSKQVVGYIKRINR